MRRKKYLHDLSTEKNFSANMGYLIPSHTRFVYPGDVVRERAEFFVRVSPMLAPILSKVMIKAESFYVPTDLVWTNAQEFYSGGQDGASTKVIPKFNISTPTSPGPTTQTGPGSLLDFLGYRYIPVTLNINALMPRVYNAIWNWHYRDRDLQTERVYSVADGPDTTTDLTLARRCWERDRFTTARLEPQRGDDVLIPMSTDPLSLADPTIETNNQGVRVVVDATQRDLVNKSISGAAATGYTGAVGSSQDFLFGDESGLQIADDAIDIASAAGTIRELEEAVAINRFRKRLQQADGSYPDYTLATFGIRSPDIELQKPVLLARSSSPLQISEVLQTSPDDGDTDPTVGVGTLFGHGIATARGHGYKYHVKRHGYIMTLFSVVPKTMYDGGVDKEHLRTTKEDYWDPDLDQIGEEAIVGRELTNENDPDEVFGYQYRNYCDRSSLDSIAGEMHDELDFWHQARKFEDPVALNSAFVTCDPTDRIFALGSTQDQLRVKAMHEVKMLRCMRRIPMRGIL